MNTAPSFVAAAFIVLVASFFGVFLSAVLAVTGRCPRPGQTQPRNDAHRLSLPIEHAAGIRALRRHGYCRPNASKLKARSVAIPLAPVPEMASVTLDDDRLANTS
jgi:hypothetical protein